MADIKIAGTLRSGSADGKIVVASEVFDSALNKFQSAINSEFQLAITNLQNRKIVKVASTLPSEVTDEYKNVVILIPQSGGVSGNYFAEYIWNEDRNEFEQFGKIQATVDLSGYYDKDEIDQQFSVVETVINELTGALAEGSFLVGKASNANTAASVGEKGVNKASLDAEVTQMVTAVDNLNTANTISPLSANQGKILKETIDTIKAVSYNETTQTLTLGLG